MMSEHAWAKAHDAHRVALLCLPRSLTLTAMALLPLLFMAMTLTGCGESDDGIRTYSVAKKEGHFGSALLTQPENPTPAQQGPSPRELVTWTMPASWHEEPSNRQMILAIFHTDNSHALEVQVSAFEGDVGGLLANVNRWRNQISLAPITQDQLGEHIEEIPTQGSFGGVFDATNEQTNTRTVAIVIQGGAGMSWFIKATGAPDKVAAEKDNIKAFAQSFKFRDMAAVQSPISTSSTGQASQAASSSGSSAATALTPAASTNQGSSMGTLPDNMLPPPADEKLTLATPDNWEPASPSSPVILQAFDVKGQGDGGNAALVTITQLRGDGGGLLANINRWRNQVDLPAVAGLDQQPLAMLDVAGSTAMLVELAAPADSAKAGQAMTMAIIARPNQTWYFKMVGRDGQLQALRGQFVAVVQSARFSETRQ